VLLPNGWRSPIEPRLLQPPSAEGDIAGQGCLLRDRCHDDFVAPTTTTSASQSPSTSSRAGGRHRLLRAPGLHRRVVASQWEDQGGVHQVWRPRARRGGPRRQPTRCPHPLSPPRQAQIDCRYQRPLLPGRCAPFRPPRGGRALAARWSSSDEVAVGPSPTRWSPSPPHPPPLFAPGSAAVGMARAVRGCAGPTPPRPFHVSSYFLLIQRKRGQKGLLRRLFLKNETLKG
jgi:hypothetical protein